MLELGLNAAVHRGREAELPGSGDPECDIAPQRMCLNLDAVDDAVKIGASVEAVVCGSGKPGEAVCPYRESCGYQRQKAEVMAADVVIAAHPAIFHHLSNEISAGLALVIIDEAWWQNGIQDSVETKLSDFADIPLQYHVQRKQIVNGVNLSAFLQKIDENATNNLHAISAKAQACFSATEHEGFVSKAVAETAGLTSADCALAIKLEWRRKIDGVIFPAMPPAARREALKAAAGNAGIARRVGIWRALQALLEGAETHMGRLQLDTDRRGARIVLHHARREVREGIAALPILYLDATMPVQIVRHFLPRLDVLADVQAATPHMTVTQIVGGWGKTSLVPNPKAGKDDPENKRRANLVRGLVDYARLNGGGDALVVTYQAIEPAFQAPGLRTGHFNAIAGLDGFRGVRSLFVIGRPFPDARALRAQALALTGRVIEPEGGGQRETRGVLMADGTGKAMSVRTYADPDMEALRAAITDAEIVQAIGRGRGVNRTADKPLSVFIFADVVLPLPVNRLVAWDHARPDVAQRMLARGALLFSPSDAAKVYPDLFPTSEVAEHSLRRWRRGDLAFNPLVH